MRGRKTARSEAFPAPRRATRWAGALTLALLVVATRPPAATGQELLGLGQPPAAAEEPARAIAPTSSARDDVALGKRLSEIYAQVDGLEGVVIDVRAGVVNLSGEVVSSAMHKKAVRIANQLQGVAEVQDEIVESRALERRLGPFLSDLRERLLAVVTSLPLLAATLLIFFLFFAAGRLAAHWEAPYRRLIRNPFARDLARQAVRVAFLLMGTIAALEILDATAVVAAVAGFAGLVGLAISFAFRDLAENYIASVLLSLRQPFRADEHVVIAGQEGCVVRLTSRATILMDLDGNHVRIPNSAVFKSTILNFSRNAQRRFGFDVGVASDMNLVHALGLGIATLKDMPGILAEPSPTAWIAAVGDWNMTLRFSAWIDQRETDWFKARGEAMRVVKKAFDGAGIIMPEPTVMLRGERSLVPLRPEAAAPGEAGDEGAPVQPQVDISRDLQIETAVAEDRATGEGDLLDASRPRE